VISVIGIPLRVAGRDEPEFRSRRPEAVIAGDCRGVSAGGQAVCDELRRPVLELRPGRMNYEALDHALARFKRTLASLAA
jgi:hypothetical protein